jgi:hypothetical protein
MAKKSKKIGKEFVVLSLEDIHPYENNPRLNEDAVPYVVESIKQCTDLDPIEVDENNVILSGHTRLLAMQQLGYKETDCIRYSGLTEAQKKKYRLLANKVAEKSFWDFDKLAEELDGLDFDGFDFGFDGTEANYSPDEFTEDFSLPDGEKPEMCTMSFTLHAEQKQLIEYAMSLVTDDVKETFGNTNKNGNALYEVVRQWAEQRK